MSFESRIPEKIMLIDDLIRSSNFWKMQNQKIVFTNGVFDLIHQGHIDYLMKSADLGNKLIVGLNSDLSVKQLNKGQNRPIQDEFSRALILASMVFVSAVVIFNEDTPKNLIESLCPDILVKGGDYKIEDIAGSDFVLKNGGNVLTIPLVQGFSTSAIEAKIKSS